MTSVEKSLSGGAANCSIPYYYGAYYLNAFTYNDGGSGPSLASAWLGPCLDLEVTSELSHAIYLESSASFLASGAIEATFSLWANFDTVADNRNIYRGSNTGLVLSGASGSPLTYLWQGDGSDWLASTGLVLTTGRWYFCAASIWPTRTLVATWDDVAGWRTYTDTQSKSSKTTSAAQTITHDGKMADVRVYDRALSEQELLAMATYARWELYAPSRRLYVDAPADGAGIEVPQGAVALAGFFPGLNYTINMPDEP